MSVCNRASAVIHSCMMQVFVGHQSVKRGGDMVFTIAQTESWLSSVL